MRPLTLVVILLTTLSLWACSKEKPEQKAQPATEQSQSAAQTAGQMAENAGKQLQESASAAKQAVEEKAAAVKQQAEEGAAAVKEQAAATTEAVKEQAAATTESAKQQVANAADQVKQALSPPTAAKPAVAAPPKGPGEVTYQASMGTVTFNHAMHSGMFACSRCHTTDPPQKIAMSKEVAHNQLCKVCHKKMGGKAPTACTGCHKK